MLLRIVCAICRIGKVTPPWKKKENTSRDSKNRFFKDFPGFKISCPDNTQ